MSVAAVQPRSLAPCCRRVAAVAALVIATLTLSACGGGDDSASTAEAPAPSPSTSRPPASNAPLAITNTAPATYQWDVLGVGKSVHGDATEQFTRVPGKYKGLKYLQTRNADQFLGTANALSFETNRPVAALVAYDARGTVNPPAWLVSWTATGDTLTSSAATYVMYRKEFAGGTISLGGNELGFNTYLVVVDDGTALGNAPPTIVGNPPRSIASNRRYEFLPTAADADGDRLAFSAANLPAWATIDVTTGRVSGVPSAAGHTFRDIVISVSDGDGLASLAAFDLTVDAAGANSPPTISAPPVPTGTQFVPYVFQPSASDPDGDTLTFTITGKPRWATFDSATGRLAGTPDRGDDGVDRDIVIRVSDGTASTALPMFSIRVYAPGEVESGGPSPTNSPPNLWGSPPTLVVAGATYSFTPSAADSDGDSLTFSIANRPSWASFSNTGRLSGTPSVTDVGTYDNILISVTDGQNVVSLPSFSIVVGAPGTNSPPVISGAPATTVTQGQAYSFTPTASDPDGNPLTFSIAGRPAWAAFDTVTGRLSGTPTASALGTSGSITISVSDGQRSASLTPFTITVSSPPPANRAPLISGAPPTQVLAGSQYSFTPTASDPDGNSLMFSVSNLPGWASFNGATGRLSGTPTSVDVGTYPNIVIRVSDGQATTSLAAFSVAVVAVATGSATLSWTPPTYNTDGSPLTNLAGYRIYWGRSQGSYANSVTLNNGGLTSYVVDQLTPGTWWFVATAVNSQGVESSFSNAASKTVQ